MFCDFNIEDMRITRQLTLTLSIISFYDTYLQAWDIKTDSFGIS